MARRKTPRRRSRKSFSILNALESLTYAEIISRGLTGTGVMGFITGEQDLGYTKNVTVTDSSFGGLASQTGSQLEGTAEISLMDLVSQPSLAIGEMQSNLSSNLVPMAVGAATTAVTFNVGRRLLRKPINNINRNLMAPLLGRGIRL